jgi:hypothetical protein
MDGNTGNAVSWLLSSAEPAIRVLTRRDLLGERVADIGEILDGAMVRAPGRRGRGFVLPPLRENFHDLGRGPSGRGRMRWLLSGRI